MKLAIIPEDIKEINLYKDKGDIAFIFGLKGLSCGYKNAIDINDIEKITKTYPNELFIAINKNIFNEDLDDLKEKLKQLDKLNIKGVLFYDIALLHLRNKLNLKLDLVWNQTHMVTNYNTCNFYYNKNVKYAIVAEEITKDEIIEINKKTNMNLMVHLIGYPNMSFSYRKLLTNYYINKNQKKEKETLDIYNNNQKYIVWEEPNGTNIINGTLLNGASFINEFKEEKISYGIINTTFIDENIKESIITYTQDILKNNNKKSLIKLNNLIGEDTMFFQKKTIYKVK